MKPPIQRTKFWSRRIKGLAATILLLIGLAWIVRYLDQNLYNSSWFTGYVMFAAVIFLAAFHWRKKLSFLPALGSAATWMQIHIYLGLSTFFIFGFHVHWTIPNGPLEQVLAAVYLAVALSGVYGLYLTRVLPKRLAIVKRQVVFEQIPRLRFELCDRARKAVFDGDGTDETLARFYVNHVAEFLERPRGFAFAMNPSGRQCKRLISELIGLDRYLSQSHRETSRSLMQLVREKDDLDYHDALQSRLKFWLIGHIAMTYSLLTFAVMHTFLVHVYAGGWR